MDNSLENDTLGCCLCNAVRDSILQKERSRIENRLLFESEYFVVIPSLGPFIEGQIMIVSKTHIPNLSSMNRQVLNDLLSVFDLIRTRTQRMYKTDLLFAEHGAHDNIQKGGACVIHMHIHCIPGYHDGIDALKSQLKILSTGSDLNKLWNINKPYILIINAVDNNIYIFEAENVPSQMIRKTLLANRGITSNWNWRANHDYELIIKTLHNWELSK